MTTSDRIASYAEPRQIAVAEMPAQSLVFGRKAVDELLVRSKRRGAAVPIRRSFLQKRNAATGPEAGPLAKFVANRDQRGLGVYLLLLAVASAWPWRVFVPSATWTSVIGLRASTTAESTLSKVFRRLEAQQLIKRGRWQGVRTVTLRREDGSGADYAHPGDRQAPEPYFRLPFAYWSGGWYERLSLSEIAVLLIALSLPPEFVLPTTRAKEWYGLSADTAHRGLRGLEERGLLAAAETANPTVHRYGRRYTLQPPFDVVYKTGWLRAERASG